MARAAAKRRQPARHHDTGRRHKDSGGQRFEDTLFFNRLRKQAKWVFVFLAVVFGGGFVLFGVGSSNVSGLSDIFQGIGGGNSGQPSISKAEKATQEHPKNAKAWHDLANAYDVHGRLSEAIAAWQTYASLKPRDVDGLSQLATDYEQQFANQTQDAQAAQIEAQTAQTTNYGPPPNSPLGRAYGNLPNPIAQAVSSSANIRFNQALSERQTTATRLVGVYERIAKLEPTEAAAQLQLAQAAQSAGSLTTALDAFKQFLRLAPDDPSAPFAKQQIKTLQSQLAAASQG